MCIVKNLYHKGHFLSSSNTIMSSEGKTQLPIVNLSIERDSKGVSKLKGKNRCLRGSLGIPLLSLPSPVSASGKSQQLRQTEPGVCLVVQQHVRILCDVVISWSYMNLNIDIDIKSAHRNYPNKLLGRGYLI